MAEFENLGIVIDVIDRFSAELDQLLFKLGQVEIAAQAVDDIVIDVDVRGNQELNTLLAQLGLAKGGSVGSGRLSQEAIDKGIDFDSAGKLRWPDGSFASDDWLDDTAGAMSIKAGVVNVDGPIKSGGKTARAMESAADAAEEAAEGFDITNLRMSDMHNLLAKLVPILVVFIGTVPVLIGALVALAAAAVAGAVALASIAAVGTMGAAMARGDGDMMAGLQDIMQELQEDFIDAFTPLAEAFSPLIEDAIDGLGRMFQQIANLGSLFRALEDEMRGFGDFISDFIVGTARDMALMVEAFAPLFGMIGEFLQDMNLMENLSHLMADVLPELMVFTGLIIGLIQRLVEMSEGFLLIATTVGIFLSGVFQLLNALGLTNERLGVLIAALLTTVTASALLSSSLFTALIPSLISVGTSVLGLIQAYTSYNVAALLATLSTYGLAKAFVALVGAVTFGIGAIAAVAGITSALSGAFSGLAGNVDSATDSLKSFRRQQRRMDSGENPYRNPDIRRGQNFGESRFGGSVNVTVEGDADEQTLRNQVQNALYRIERPLRKS